MADRVRPLLADGIDVFCYLRHEDDHEALTTRCGCSSSSETKGPRYRAAMIDGMEGRVAVVTGGASGIGKATADALERCGVEVEVIDQASDPPRDVTDRAALDAVAADLRQRHGRLDVLVNAAGVLTPNKPVDELSPEDFHRNFEINLLGVFQACQAFAPLLREARGAVVNVASQAALVPAAPGRVHGRERCGCGADPLARDRLGRARRARERGRSGLHPHTDDRDLLRESRLHRRPRRGRIPLGRILEAARSRERSSSWRAPSPARSPASSCLWTAAGRPASPRSPGNRVRLAVGVGSPGLRM